MPHYHFEDQADDFGATVRLDRLNDKVREETERGATQEFHPVKPASSLQPSPREKVKPSGASGRSSVSMPGQESQPENKNFWNRRGNSKVVSMPQTQSIKMVISQPTSFEQSEGICDLLKEKKSVIVNLEYVNKDIARRIVDVVSGAVHALDGHIQKVSNSIFLIAPYNYEITNEMAREEIKNRLSVSWLRNNNGNN